MINFIKQYEPSEIHFFVSSPPIVNNCNYGVDFPDIEELISNKKTISQLKEELNINSLMYLKDNLFLHNIINKNKFCLECLNK